MKRNTVILIFLACCIASFLVEIVETSKAKKVAKEVAKAAIGRKLNKSHSRRWFPIWLIVVLVLGGLLGLVFAVFLCFYCRVFQSLNCRKPDMV
ncbi:hypothetical protein TNIN_131971 [Trichonephila inaurata madagascariensis]|uniref:Uncharacterized protein n=1 Tax=Trichonephila inaurata madagascariensis TaxID=2747483 RepID=A0A8X6YA39_9ARAC|nr:hypothetical protein TNIN_131971 [Trichonephila inaurata madagascariensis]